MQSESGGRMWERAKCRPLGSDSGVCGETCVAFFCVVLAAVAITQDSLALSRRFASRQGLADGITSLE